MLRKNQLHKSFFLIFLALGALWPSLALADEAPALNSGDTAHADHVEMTLWIVEDGGTVRNVRRFVGHAVLIEPP